MHQKHRAARIRRDGMGDVAEIGGILILVVFAMIFCVIYLVDSDVQTGEERWRVLFGYLIEHFQDVAGGAAVAMGDLESGNGNDVHVPSDHVRSVDVEIEGQLDDIPTAVPVTTTPDACAQILNVAQRLATTRAHPIAEETLGENREMPIDSDTPL